MDRFSSGDVIAFTAALAIVVILFVDYEKAAMRMLLSKKLISEAQYKGRVSKLVRWALGLLTVAVFVAYAVQEYCIR
jgi:hypothetical protein